MLADIVTALNKEQKDRVKETKRKCLYFCNPFGILFHDAELFLHFCAIYNNFYKNCSQQECWFGVNSGGFFSMGWFTTGSKESSSAPIITAETLQLHVTQTLYKVEQVLKRYPE